MFGEGVSQQGQAREVKACSPAPHGGRSTAKRRQRESGFLPPPAFPPTPGLPTNNTPTLVSFHAASCFQGLPPPPPNPKRRRSERCAPSRGPVSCAPTAQLGRSDCCNASLLNPAPVGASANRQTISHGPMVGHLSRFKVGASWYGPCMHITGCSCTQRPADPRCQQPSPLRLTPTYRPRWSSKHHADHAMSIWKGKR